VALEGAHDLGRGPRHDTTQDGANQLRVVHETAHQLRTSAPKPGESRDVGLSDHAPVIRQTEVRMSIADVEKQEMGRTHQHFLCFAGATFWV